MEKELASLREAYEAAGSTSVEAPGRMQSRYDTMGIDSAWVATGLAKILNEKMRDLAALRSLRLPAASL